MKAKQRVQMSRREFAGGLMAAFAALGWDGCISVPKSAEHLSAWQPGELDLHFIYTGCGENMFYRLPDGTAILNDVGEFYRPRDLAEIPLLPSADRLGGDWVTRYIHRVYPEETIDYALFSHWHGDHIGHKMCGTPATPAADYRFRATADGRQVNGLTCVTEDFRIRRCLVHDASLTDRYGSGDTSRLLFQDFLAAERPKGLQLEPFRVGALNQIRLQRDPEKYRGTFLIRNLCAYGQMWDGQNGVIDFAADYLKGAKAKRISQNMLSMGFVMRYGKFGYFSGGDFERNLMRRPNGKKEPMDGLLGKLVGPVDVAKMSHHGCGNALSQEFLDAVKADAYVGCMWCPSQSSPDVMTRIVKAGSSRGRRPLILPQIVCARHRTWAEANGWDFGYAQAVHVVIRVAPGGDSYRVYLLDAADEEMRVLATFDRA